MPPSWRASWASCTSGPTRPCSWAVLGGSPYITGTILGVPILRITIFWGLYWGPPYLGKLPLGGSGRPKRSGNNGAEGLGQLRVRGIKKSSLNGAVSVGVISILTKPPAPSSCSCRYQAPCVREPLSHVGEGRSCRVQTYLRFPHLQFRN